MAVILGPSAITAARRTRFSSSRTLPGQACERSAATASFENPVAFRPASAEKRRSSESAITTTSSSRSRSGGSAIVTTPMR